MTDIGPILLVLALAVPLAMAMLAPFVGRPLMPLPWAAVPGLAAAFLVPIGATVEFPTLLIGMQLRLDRVGAVFLGFGALLWCLSGAYARSYLAERAHLASFAAFWLLVLAGTLGTFIAADVVTFYAAFSLMSLATYGLVVHDRSPSARRAGRIYIVLAVLGEFALLAGFMLAASEANSVSMAAVRAGLASSPRVDYIVAGLLIGFGIKAGLVPLHVWLPLAHPEAPTPASAVLSGVIVTAGIVGLMRLVSVEALSPEWGGALAILGIITAYYGVAAGLMQADPKAILAYSTLSQMGLVVTVLSSGASGAQPNRAADAVALYACQHGLAKAALFLAVGIVAASGVRALLPVFAVTAFAAFSIAGLPLSGGALAKLAIKDQLGGGAIGLAVTLSATGTAMLMFRFLWALRQPTGREADRSPPSGLVIPWGAVLVAMLAVPWALFPALSGVSPDYALYPGSLWSALWPILVAVIPAILWQRWVTSEVVPRGDIVVLFERSAFRVRSAIAKLEPRIIGLLTEIGWLAVFRSPSAIDTVERALRQWSVSGSALIVTAALIGFLLAL